MSAVLAVWEGESPVTDEAGEQIFAELDALGDQPPTPRIEAFVHALLARYPDIGDEAGDDSPWADGPLIGDARGPLFCFSMSYGHPAFEDAFEFIAETAEAHGLVMFDPENTAVIVPDLAAQRRAAKKARRRRWFGRKG
jgi:hypothetical protein